MREEAILLQNVLRCIQPDVGDLCSVRVCDDKDGALYLSNNQVSSACTTHMDVHRHFLRELVSSKQISIGHVASEE